MLPQQDLVAATESVQSAAQDAPRTIEVVAKRFTFEPSRIEVREGERVRLVHGHFSVESRRGEGTRIQAQVPLRALTG